MIQEGLSEDLPTIGIIGVTIPATADCLQKIGALSCNYFKLHQHPNIILHQLNFEPIYFAQCRGAWNEVTDKILVAIKVIEQIGVDFCIIPTNTIHKVFNEIKTQTKVPLLDMISVVADECLMRNCHKVGVMGTIWTMQEHLYRHELKVRGIDEMLPSVSDQQIINNSIFQELVPNGKVNTQTNRSLQNIVTKFKKYGCDAVILACTELPLVLNEENCGIPIVDTTKILAEAAIKQAFVLFSAVVSGTRNKY